MAKCTVLLSVYNGSDSVDQCLQSVFEQDFQDYEVVCVNDASTDGSGNIIRKWENIFGQNRFFYLKNGARIGLTKSLNRGLDTIKSEYTARIDADDRWHPEKLGKQIRFMEMNKPYGVVGCNYVNLRNGKENKIWLYEKDEDIRRKIMKGNPFAHSCVVFRTDLINKVGGYDEKIKFGQDYDLWLRCLPHTKFHNLPEFLCTRKADSSESTVNKKEQMLQGMKTRIKYIRKYRYPASDYFYLLRPFATMVFHGIFKKGK